jgi:hypothetical protein
MKLTRIAVISVVAVGLTFEGCKKASLPSAENSSSRESAQTIQLVDIATDQNDLDDASDTEPSIAVNPVNTSEIAIVAFSGAWGTDAMAPVWKSRDGGVHWTKVPQIPAPTPNLEGPGDQKISYDSDGRLVIAELGVAGTNAKNFIYHQTHGPDDPLTPGAVYGDDQPHVIVAVQTTSCANSIYSAWLRTQPQNARSMDSLSKDSGDHVVDVGVGDNHQYPNRTTRVTIGPEGRAYIVYKTREGAAGGNFETAHFRVLRSDDCGNSFLALGGSQGVSITGNQPVRTVFTNNFGNPAKGKVARARSSDAWIATSSHPGEVYVAYVNEDESNFAQVFVARSADAGVSWTSTRITDGKHHSSFPEIAVASNGAIGVMYIDFDDSQANTIFRHRFAMSVDLGRSWQNTNLQSMDPTGIQNAASGFLWGDYEGLTAMQNTFYGVFTGESIGRSLRQLDPVFYKVSALPMQ